MEQLKAKTDNISTKNKTACWIRAVRLPFITASIFPFTAGTFLFHGKIDITRFAAGLVCVTAAHLGANLMNDYADSKSGADWQDKKFYGLFGGSKLIQEEILSEKDYLRASIGFFALAFFAVLLLTALLQSAAVIGFYIFIMLMGISYSWGILRFSYRYMGEAVIFILFGPALVMGGYFIQTLIFPSLSAFFLAVPFGLFTCAILFANEVPDYKEDLKAKKFTWVKLTGADNAYILYYVLMLTGICFVFLNIRMGILSYVSMLALIILPLIIKAGTILKTSYNDKSKLVKACKLTIFAQTMMGVLIIMGLLI